MSCCNRLRDRAISYDQYIAKKKTCWKCKWARRLIVLAIIAGVVGFIKTDFDLKWSVLWTTKPVAPTAEPASTVKPFDKVE